MRCSWARDSDSQEPPGESLSLAQEQRLGAVLGQGTATHRNPPVSKLARCRTSSVLIPAVREWLALEDAVLHKSFRFFWVAVVLCAGCAHKAATYQKATGLSEGESGQASLEFNTPREGVFLRSSVAGGGGGAVLAAPRFVAVRHKLEIVEAGSGLAKSIEAVVAFCGTIQCEVLSSSVTNETAVLSPSGNITARVAPRRKT